MHRGAQLRLAEPSEKAVSPKIEAALALLAEAYKYAQDTECNTWEFAVRFEALQAEGLKLNDCRWLVRKGYAEAGCEKTLSCCERREIAICPGQSLSNRKCRQRSCFVLTDAGRHFVQEIVGLEVAPCTTHEVSVHEDEPRQEPVLRPRWDAELRELHVGQQMVKRYRCRAANQEAILAAFEEEGWPTHIYDPLTGGNENLHPHRRLNDAVRGLNRHQKTALIRFSTDGTGEGVRWDWAISLPTDDQT